MVHEDEEHPLQDVPFPDETPEVAKIENSFFTSCPLQDGQNTSVLTVLTSLLNLLLHLLHLYSNIGIPLPHKLSQNILF